MATLNLNGIELAILQDLIPATAPLPKALTYARLRSRLALTPEQEEEAGIVRLQLGGGQVSIACEHKEVRWPFELAEGEMETLVDLCRSYERWPSSEDTLNLVGQIGDVSGRALQ